MFLLTPVGAASHAFYIRVPNQDQTLALNNQSWWFGDMAPSTCTFCEFFQVAFLLQDCALYKI